MKIPQAQQYDEATFLCFLADIQFTEFNLGLLSL